MKTWALLQPMFLFPINRSARLLNFICGQPFTPFYGFFKPSANFPRINEFRGANLRIRDLFVDGRRLKSLSLVDVRQSTV